MKIVSLVTRILIALGAVFALWNTTAQERADIYANTRTTEGWVQASRLQPGNEDYISERAVFLAVNGDPSPAVDRDLQTAVAMNPADADALMALGVRAERRGDNVAARNYLERAASVSMLFKPAWTLANFYFRTGEDKGFWSMIQRCLSMIESHNLEPSTFDPGPVFDLAWHQDPNAARIRALVPRREATMLPYLRYLQSTDRVGPALDVWPDVLAVADPSYPPDSDTLLNFGDYLLSTRFAPAEAASVWNDLIKHGFVQSAPLDIAAGDPVENPDFVYPPISRFLSWFPARTEGVFVTASPHALRFEFTGNEPEAFDLVTKLVPLGPARKWRLTWEADVSRIEATRGAPSGLTFQFSALPSPDAGAAAAGGVSGCPAPGLAEKGSCAISVPPAAKVLSLAVHYQRPPGATRIKGVFVLSSVHLERVP